MTWTSEPPTAEGYWWWRSAPPDAEASIDFWERDEDGELRTWEGNFGMSGESIKARWPACQWAGPIPSPK